MRIIKNLSLPFILKIVIRAITCSTLIYVYKNNIIDINSYVDPITERVPFMLWSVYSLIFGCIYTIYDAVSDYFIQRAGGLTRFNISGESTVLPSTRDITIGSVEGKPPKVITCSSERYVFFKNKCTAEIESFIDRREKELGGPISAEYKQEIITAHHNRLNFRIVGEMYTAGTTDINTHYQASKLSHTQGCQIRDKGISLLLSQQKD